VHGAGRGFDPAVVAEGFGELLPGEGPDCARRSAGWGAFAGRIAETAPARNKKGKFDEKPSREEMDPHGVFVNLGFDWV
jgi:hypothetical protein